MVASSLDATYLTKGERRRESIIKGALELMAQRGVRALTLDAVAKHVGVSKGGLVHHFANKEALVKEIVSGATGILHQRMEEALRATDADRDVPGRFTRMYVEVTLAHAGEGYLLPLFELVAANPGRALPLAHHNDWCHQQLENDGIDPVLAHIIASAADGLWVEIVFGLEKADSWRVRAMKATVLEMARKRA